jgi:hypothetical protein
MNVRTGAGLTVVACLAIAAGVALAESKTEAKQHQEDLIKEATTTLQGFCGCPGPKYEIDWSSYSRAIDMEHLSHPARVLADNKPRFCSDNLKAAWCKWSKGVVYKIHFSKTKKYTFSASKDGKTFDCGTAPYEESEPACDGEPVIDAFKNAN